MSGNPIPEELVLLLHAVSEDRRLREWLLSLEQFPPAMRQAELLRMTAEMRAAGEDAALTAAKPHFYAAACSTLREL
jgi:hypothetical protein